MSDSVNPKREGDEKQQMTNYRVNIDLKLDVTSNKDDEASITEEVKKFLASKIAGASKFNDPLIFDFKVVGFVPLEDDE